MKRLQQSNMCVLRASRFTENQSGASGGGMSVFATRLTTTRNCTFVRNSALSSGALDFVSSCTCGVCSIRASTPSHARLLPAEAATCSQHAPTTSMHVVGGGCRWCGGGNVPNPALMVVR